MGFSHVSIREELTAKVVKEIAGINPVVIVASVRKKFTENILIVAAQFDADTKKFFTDHFAQAAPQSYDFVKNFNITRIVADEPPKFPLPVVVEWLKSCGLNMQNIL